MRPINLEAIFTVVLRLALHDLIFLFTRIIIQAPVVQTSDSAVHRRNHYPVDSAIVFPDTYPLDSDLSGGERYPTFEQPGPELRF